MRYGATLLHGVIYDFLSQRRMKNKFDFQTPFADQPPNFPPFNTPCLVPPPHARGNVAVKHNQQRQVRRFPENCLAHNVQKRSIHVKVWEASQTAVHVIVGKLLV